VTLEDNICSIVFKSVLLLEKVESFHRYWYDFIKLKAMPSKRSHILTRKGSTSFDRRPFSAYNSTFNLFIKKFTKLNVFLNKVDIKKCFNCLQRGHMCSEKYFSWLLKIVRWGIDSTFGIEINIKMKRSLQRRNILGFWLAPLLKTMKEHKEHKLWAFVSILDN